MVSVFWMLSPLIDTTMTNTGSQNMAGSNIYIVLIITLLVWGGVLFYLIYLDRKLKFLKSKWEAKSRSEEHH